MVVVTSRDALELGGEVSGERWREIDRQGVRNRADVGD